MLNKELKDFFYKEGIAAHLIENDGRFYLECEMDMSEDVWRRSAEITDLTMSGVISAFHDCCFRSNADEIKALDSALSNSYKYSTDFRKATTSLDIKNFAFSKGVGILAKAPDSSRTNGIAADIDGDIIETIDKIYKNEKGGKTQVTSMYLTLSDEAAVELNKALFQSQRFRDVKGEAYYGNLSGDVKVSFVHDADSQNPLSLKSIYLEAFNAESQMFDHIELTPASQMALLQEIEQEIHDRTKGKEGIREFLSEVRLDKEQSQLNDNIQQASSKFSVLRYKATETAITLRRNINKVKVSKSFDTEQPFEEIGDIQKGVSKKLGENFAALLETSLGTPRLNKFLTQAEIQAALPSQAEVEAASVRSAKKSKTNFFKDQIGKLWQKAADTVQYIYTTLNFKHSINNFKKLNDYTFDSDQRRKAEDMILTESFETIGQLDSFKDEITAAKNIIERNLCNVLESQSVQNGIVLENFRNVVSMGQNVFEINDNCTLENIEKYKAEVIQLKETLSTRLEAIDKYMDNLGKEAEQSLIYKPGEKTYSEQLKDWTSSIQARDAKLHSEKSAIETLISSFDRSLKIMNEQIGVVKKNLPFEIKRALDKQTPLEKIKDGLIAKNRLLHSVHGAEDMIRIIEADLDSYKEEFHAKKGTKTKPGIELSMA